MKDGETTGPVEPNHVLAFEETSSDQPGDKGAFILNKTDEIKPDEEMKFLSWIRKRLFSQPTDKAEVGEEIMTGESETKLELVNKALEEKDVLLKQKDSELSSISTELKAKSEEIESLKKELLAFKEKQEEDEWLAFKEEYVPPGWTHTPEKEKEVREEYNKDKVAFMKKVMKSFKSAPTKQEGSMFIASGTESDVKVDQEFMRKAHIPEIEFSTRD